MADFHYKIGKEIVRDEELQRAQDGILHVVAEPQPVAFHVEVLLEDDLVEEDVLGQGQPLALGITYTYDVHSGWRREVQINHTKGREVACV